MVNPITETHDTEQTQFAQINAVMQNCVNLLTAEQEPRRAIVETLRAAAEVLGSLGVIELGHIAHNAKENTLRCNVFLRDGHEQDITGSALDRDWPVDHPTMVIPWNRIQSEIFVWGLTSDETVLVPEVRSFHEANGARSVAYQPLRHGQKVIGWIALSFRSETPPTPKQIELIQTLAAQVSLAVEMERLANASRDAAINREREIAAQERSEELSKANLALQTTIDALSEITSPEQIIPRVLEIVGSTFNCLSCAAYKNDPSGKVWLQYWYFEGKVYLPEEILQLDRDNIKMLAAGFEVPDDYLGGPPANVIGPVLLNHFTGTSVAEFDSFAIASGWDLELNIGVASKGIRAFTLCIYRGHQHPFTEQEIILGEALAKQLGLAMETCRLIEEAREAATVREQKRAALARAEELERASNALQETIDEVSKLQTLHDFIPHALRIVARAFGVTSAAYFEHPDDTIYLRWWFLDDTIYGPEELPGLDSTHLKILSQLAKGFTVPIDHLGVHFRQRTSSSIIHHRTATASPPLHAFAVSMGWDWELNVPLMVNGMADGAIVLFRAQEHPFTEDDFSLAESLGKQIALAMQTSSIAEREREASLLREREIATRQRLNELTKTNDALKQSLDIMAVETDLEKALCHILTAISLQLKSKTSALWLYDKATDRFSIHLAHVDGDVVEVKPGNEHLLKGAWSVGRDLALKDHITSRKPVVYQVHDLKKTNHCDPEYFVTQGIHSLLGVPLLLGTDIIGSLTVRFDKPRELTPEELQLTQAMAHQATMTIQLTTLARYAGQSAVNEERSRLARDVHDTLAQGFTAILIHLKTLRKQLSLPVEAIETMDTLQQVAQNNLIEARRYLWKLRPRVLSQGSIADGLRRLIDSAERAGDIKIELKVCELIPSIPEKVEDELIRIAQEALQNALRYGEGTQIIVALQSMDHLGVNLSISDNGRGFNTSTTTPGYGLVGMRERADCIGAALTIVSEPGYGTEIIVSWLPPENHHGAHHATSE